MLMKENMIVVNHLEAAMERLKEYLKTTGLYQYVISQEKDIIVIEFQPNEAPSQEHLNVIRNIFYWTDELEVPHIEGLVHFYKESNSLIINIKHYNLICEVLAKLKEFKVTVKNFDFSLFAISFEYIIYDKPALSYDQLLEIHKLVNPNGEDLDELSVYKMENVSTLRVKLSPLASNV